MTTLTNSPATVAIRMHAVSKPVRTGVFTRLVTLWRNRRDTEELLDLNDHQLADIGLTRGDVRRALAGPFACDPSVMLGAMRERRLSAHHENR